MSQKELLALPVASWAEDRAHLYLWTTNTNLRDAFDLMEAWGFAYVTTLTWVKPSFGLGAYFRTTTEHVLFGVRGRRPVAPSRAFIAPCSFEVRLFAMDG